MGMLFGGLDWIALIWLGIWEGKRKEKRKGVGKRKSTCG